MNEALDLFPRRTLSLNPEEYLSMSPERKNNVRETHFRLPKLGDDDFGRFVVTLKTPEYALGSEE